MNSPSSFSFGDWLRQQRQLHDWTQDELAIQVNCSVGTLRRFEQDGGRPSRPIAELLAARFAIPPAERAAFVRWARRAPNAAPPPSVVASFHHSTVGASHEPATVSAIP